LSEEKKLFLQVFIKYEVEVSVAKRDICLMFLPLGSSKVIISSASIRDNTYVISMENVSMCLKIFLQIRSVIPVKIKILPRTSVENWKGYCTVKPEAWGIPKMKGHKTRWLPNPALTFLECPQAVGCTHHKAQGKHYHEPKHTCITKHRRGRVLTPTD